jgi:hypothetical protein
METIEQKKLHILQHSLGLDKYGQGNQYRNHFCTGLETDDYDTCQTLVADGLMERREPSALTGGDYCFLVTPKGVDFVALNSPPPPKVTRGQQRYRKYRSMSDCFDSFLDFLYWDRQQQEKERVGY